MGGLSEKQTGEDVLSEEEKKIDTKTMSTDEVTAMISRLCIGIDVIATVLGKDITDDSNKTPTHKPKGKWRFREI